ncbi:protein of unknown function [Xenorhabdus nematophila AN6/1]|nr:protein of unknown function [Xenorhabdus nematophila AN6/1]
MRKKVSKRGMFRHERSVHRGRGYILLHGILLNKKRRTPTQWETCSPLGDWPVGHNG